MKSSSLGPVSISDSKIVVRVIGTGFGEAIIVTIGKKILVGIDCSASLVRSAFDQESVLGGILSELEEGSTIIWIISHFHFDHFQGMAWLLRYLGPHADGIHRIVIPRVRSSADIKNLIALDEGAESGWQARYHIAQAEYAHFAKELKRLAHKSCDFAGRVTIAEASILGDEFGQMDFLLEAFAPNRWEVDEGEADAVSSFINGKIDRRHANEGSYIVRLSCGSFEALFLGDVPLDNSEALLCEEIQEEWVSRNSFLKVAHHGAEDATSKKLLLRLAPEPRLDSPCAVIAPFRRHGLPKESVVRLILENGYDLSICGGGQLPPEFVKKIEADYRGICPMQVVRGSTDVAGLVRQEFYPR